MIVNYTQNVFLDFSNGVLAILDFEVDNRATNPSFHILFIAVVCFAWPTVCYDVEAYF